MPRPGLLLLALIAPAALLAGCGESRLAPDEPLGGAEQQGARVDVFLRASGQAPEPVTMELEALGLRDAGGVVHELELSRASVSSVESAQRVALAGGPVPPERYRALVLRLRGAARGTAGARVPLRLLPPAPPGEEPLAPDPAEAAEVVEYEVPLALRILWRDAVSLFLEWDVEASRTDGGFRPVLGPSLEAPQVRLGLLYVTDAATGAVLAVSRATGQVVATGKVGARPSSLAVSRDRRELFVANAGDGSVSIVDTQRNFADSTIPVRLAAGTSDVAVAEDRRLLVAANPNLDTVSFFDLRGPSRIEDVRVGRGPTRLVVVPALRRLFVANALSNDVSVVDLGTRSVVATVPVESQPTYVETDRRGRQVFVGHRVSPNLTVLDAETLAVAGTIFVGGDVTALLADRRRDLLYVARSRPAEIAVVNTRVEAVVRRIPISGRVAGLAQPPEGPLLFGAAPELGGLVVVDLLASREETMLPCGTTPTDVATTD